ncbi:unnamed protein product [Angiostrongylus costaricensis]|uniref:DDE Tnp4 domain-containing protein n=1 Tax=Angiostrongylus costaricensis TaxID=334426 RepID=A0A0R3PCX6_ANGCS|nr:unnamed protein product [Angiostrongylus costaricensis]
MITSCFDPQVPEKILTCFISCTTLYFLDIVRSQLLFLYKSSPATNTFFDPQNRLVQVCIFGDLGYFHGNSTQSLIRNGLAEKFDFIVHLGHYFLGDIAYDLHANNGTTGDKYMNQLEPLFSKMSLSA